MIKPHCKTIHLQAFAPASEQCDLAGSCERRTSGVDGPFIHLRNNCSKFINQNEG